MANYKKSGGFFSELKEDFADWCDEITGGGKAVNLNELKLDIETAQQILRDMSALAEEIRTHREKAVKLLYTIDAGWQGQSAEDVEDMCGTWYGEQKTIADMIDWVVAQYTKSINTMIEADTWLAEQIEKM